MLLKMKYSKFFCTHHCRLAVDTCPVAAVLDSVGLVQQG